MKDNRYIVMIMLLVSVLLLAVPVMPHHHHASADICMRHDINPDEAHRHQHDNPTHHDADPCCDGGCVTHIRTLLSAMHIDWSPQHTIIMVLFDDMTVDYLLSPQERMLRRHYVYIESLHSVNHTNHYSLRAPPAVGVVA